ncbi:MAG: hypothetical protein PHF97_04525 [Bacteroidales bacterium]|nr:hypothetical protein [Bacteroidales bacterium]MDD4603052.1 hypothetical protein [Bacteroidales bacterium]
MTEIINKVKNIRWQHLVFIMLIAMVAVGTDGCKTTGKLSKKERKAQIEYAKKQLQPIIDGTSTLSLDEQGRLISELTNKNYNDPTLNSMLLQASQKVKKAYADQEKAKAQKVDVARAALYDLLLNKDNKTADELAAALSAIKAQNLSDDEITELIGRVEKKIQEMRANGSGANLPVKTQLENAFNTIVNSAKTGNLSMADNTINNTLQLFSADNAPVLVIISREGSMVDYDKPTTIRKYLEFLKDRKTNLNAIDAIMVDSNGKIKELDLIKK